MRHAAWFCGIALAVGILIGDGAAWAHGRAQLVGLGAALCALVLALSRRSVAASLATLCAWCCAGMHLAIPRERAPPVPAWLLAEKAALGFQGRIVEPPQRAYGRTQVSIDVSRVTIGGRWVSVRFRVRAYVQGLAHHLTLDDDVVGRGRFRPLRVLDNPGGFDGARGLRYAGVAAALTLPSLDALSRRAARRAGGVWARLDGWRAETIARLGSGVLGEGGLVGAMALGDRGGLTRQDRDDFALTGVSHAIAVSGQHLVLVVFLAFALLRALLARWFWLATRVSPRRVAAVLALLLAVGYTLMVGAPYSALRALAVAALFFVGAALGRQSRASDALATGALAILAASPGALFDVGFQLSVVAVAGLLWVSPPLRVSIDRWLRVERSPTAPRSWSARVRRVVSLTLSATLGATLVTAPLVAFYFQLVTPLGLLGSLVVVPLLELWVLPVAMLATALPLGADGLWAAAEAGAYCARQGLDLLLALDGAALRVCPPTVLECVALLLAAFAAVRWRRFGFRLLAIVAAVVFVSSTSLGAGLRRWTSELRVTFLSVGHGDAALVQTPGGHAVLIDGGGAIHPGGFDVGRFVVVPALRALGVTHLDAIVLSHPHLDHAGGLAAVVRELEVKALWTSGLPFGRGAAELERAVRDRRTPMRHFRAGDARVELGGVLFEALSPLTSAEEPAPYFDELGENDNSLVLRVRYGRFTALFPGDLEAEGEHLLGTSTDGLVSTLVKAPHHGSRTSSTAGFVASSRPRFVIYSVGEGNTFGFPHEDVVSRWRAAGASAWRTDLDGAVTVTTDGARVDVTSRRSGRREALELAPVGPEDATPAPALPRVPSSPASSEEDS